MVDLGKILNVKIIFSFVIILILGAGGFFYWQNQKDVRDLNKTLPKGVKVEKSLLGGEYRVVNKIDGYEFKIPEGWRGVKEIDYIPERKEEDFRGTSINIEGLEGLGRSISVDRFQVLENFSLQEWAKKFFNTYGLVGNFSQGKAGNINIVKTQESVHLGGEFVYFFEQNSIVYALTGGSEDFIREIISNGKW